MCDLLWSDPIDTYDKAREVSPSDELFRPNLPRGCSYSFTYAAVCKFLDENNLLSVFRAHEVQYNGYRMYKERECEDGQFPSMITIFSAPNYCDDHGNKAAVLEYGLNDVLNIKQFKAVEHPYHLPAFANVFSWSLPFVQEKVCEFILTLSQIDLKEIDETSHKLEIEELAKRKEIIQNKIRALGRLANLFTNIRKQNEAKIKLRAAPETGPLPLGVRTSGPIALETTHEFFHETLKAHSKDEMMPQKN